MMKNLSIKQEPTFQELHEFYKAAAKLDKITCLCSDEQLIIQTNYNEAIMKGVKTNQFEERLMMLVTNGLDKMYEIPLTYEYLDKHVKKVNFLVSWEAYFELFKNALHSIRLREEIDEETDDKTILLEFFYPLLQGARIRGTFVLEDRFEIKGMLRH